MEGSPVSRQSRERIRVIKSRLHSHALLKCSWECGIPIFSKVYINFLIHAQSTMFYHVFKMVNKVACIKLTLVYLYWDIVFCF